jgi:hypothetical protein
MAIPVVVVSLLKQVVAKALYTKVTKELDRGLNKVVSNADNETIEIVETIEQAVISKKKVSGWATVAISLVYFASAQGYIDPAIADLVSSILSNPETVTAIEGMVE